jgi:hypothetical protein
MPQRRKRHDTRLEDLVASVFWTVVFVVVFVSLALLQQQPPTWYETLGVVLLIGIHVRVVVWVVDWLFWLITGSDEEEDA